MSCDSIFSVVDMQFIDATLRFAAFEAKSLYPLHLHLANYAMQQMALEQILGGNHG